MAAHFPAIVDHHTYVLASDGDLMEGVSQEAIAIAGHLQALQADRVLGRQRHLDRRQDSVARRQRRSGRALQGRPAGTRAAIDGHDPQAILNAVARRAERPTSRRMIACKTTIGFGLPTKAGTNKAHGEALGAAEIAGARKNLELALRAVRRAGRHPRRLARRSARAARRSATAGGEARRARSRASASRIRAAHPRRAAGGPRRASSTPTSASSPPTRRRSRPARRARRRST